MFYEPLPEFLATLYEVIVGVADVEYDDAVSQTDVIDTVK